MHELSLYVPESVRQSDIEFDTELAPVIGRISNVIPRDVIWSLYVSTPGETGGRTVFPYCRVDTAVIGARNYVYILKNYAEGLSPQEFREMYDQASKNAFEALVWVEIGFLGLENLAKSPASRNWTSAVGHFVTPAEREAGIMTTGTRMYMGCLSEFKEFRIGSGIRDDHFALHAVEYLLDTVSAP